MIIILKQLFQNCAKIREQKEGTWLISDMQEAYTQLYYMNYGHSVEVYKDDRLIGGLYCVSLGRAIFGESMFSLAIKCFKNCIKSTV